MQTSTFDIHASTMENVFISISGMIGAGKTTLADALAEKLGLPVYHEPVRENAYLADFYKETKKYAFNMQIYLLNERFAQQQQIIWSNKGGVQDRTIYEDSIFAQMLCDSGLMDERDFLTYRSLFRHMSNFMKKPNIIVHLDVSPEESMRRIQMRARGVESGISIEYLRNLYKAYNVFIQEISRIIPVIKVDYEKFRTVEEMTAAIVEQYRDLSNIRVVTFASGEPSIRVATPPGTPGASIAAMSLATTPAASQSSQSSSSQSQSDESSLQREGASAVQAESTCQRRLALGDVTN